MIIKLIETKAKPKDAERRAHYLTRYLATADRRWLGREASALDHGLTLSSYMTTQPDVMAPTGERVLFKGALVNGGAQDWDNGVAEVERRLAKRSTKVKKPVRHGVLSLREGELLTESQCDAAVSTLAAELGCERSAILWAAHGDTHNFHLHMMFVTVDAETGEAVPFGRGPKGQTLWKEAMQRAIARIEASHQLQPEMGSRYRMEGQEIVRNPETAPAGRKRSPISQERLSWEAQSGFVSFTRYAQDVAGPILDEAESWQRLHAELAPHGLGIRASVNGGELYAGDERVRLSRIDRKHSWGKLTHADRLGPYVPPDGMELAPYIPRIHDSAKAREWLERKGQEEKIARAIDRRVAALLAARDAALADAAALLSAIGNDIAAFDGDRRLARDLSSAMPRLRASTLGAIRAAFASRIDAVRALRLSVATCDDLSAVDIQALEMPDVGIVATWSAVGMNAKAYKLAGYDAEQAGNVVRYWRADDRRRQGQPALIDAGQVIWVNDRSDDTIAAAIRLAQHRFDQVAVFGDAAYLRQCAAVSKKLGIPITVISVAEGERRAREHRNARNQARRLALQTHAATVANAAIQRSRWRDAYRRAISASALDDHDGASRSGEIPHHGALPTLAALSDRAPVVQPSHRPTGRPRPSPGLGIE